MRNHRRDDYSGFTLVELVIGLTVLAIVAISMTGLFTSLVGSSVVAKQKAVASTLATNQMEYLKSLPYDSLAVQGGSIIAQSYISATTNQTVNGVKYTIKTAISYVDDAYDGCGSYPTQQLKETYCRNYPPPSGAPATDANPADYKDANVSVFNASNTELSQVDTQISARVAETASTTGAMFVNVIDSDGNPVSGATVHVVNSAVGPVDVSDSTDENGIAIFYGLPSDSNFDYVITASKNGYSTLNTIAASGTLQPTYPNQKILSQQSSYVTLPIKQQGADSLLIEAVDTAGSPLTGMKIYVKGGYKKYTSTTDTSYYFDNMTPSDTRTTTDSGGLEALSNLVPGSYIFCGDAGATSCGNGSTTYYLAAAVPYGGTNSLNPISVPTYDPSNPPATTYPYNGDNYYQKVRLILTTSATFPRVFTLSPYELSLSSDSLSSFGFTITGVNLPSSSSVKFSQSGNNYPATCVSDGASPITTLNCTVNFTGVSAGSLQLSVTANGQTLTLPTTPLGGMNVTN